jgi:hypothetical protein
MAIGAIKAAELASSLGAGVVGAGLALLAADLLGPFALPILLAGLLLHGTGMTLKHRLESAARAPLWWENALFWACWIALAALAGAVLYNLAFAASR